MTADALLPSLLIPAAVGSGLIAGLFCAFSACVMRALGRLPPSGAIAAIGQHAPR